MNNCGCYQEIYPECDMTRWEVSPSVYPKECCIKANVVGHKLILSCDTDCLYVDGHKAVIGG